VTVRTTKTRIARALGLWSRVWLLLVLVALAGPAAAAPPAAAPPATTASPPPASAPAQPAPAPATPAAEPGDGEPLPGLAPDGPVVRESEYYGDRLDGLQGDVDDLKDRIFRSKSRLALLKETVLRGVMAGSRVVVAHRNLMSSQFRLVKMTVFLDGAQIFARSDTASQDNRSTLDEEDEVIVFDGNLVPGAHTLAIELSYRGRGFGVFAYLNGYTFESRSSYTFEAPENGSIRILSVGFERGNLTTEMKDRPAVDWQEIPLDAAGRPIGKAGKGKASGETRTDKKARRGGRSPTNPAKGG
jgi:hypothetical protein